MTPLPESEKQSGFRSWQDSTGSYTPIDRDHIPRAWHIYALVLVLEVALVGVTILIGGLWIAHAISNVPIP
jgi:hypothetical protein